MNDQTELNNESRAEGQSRLNDVLGTKVDRYLLLSCLFLKQENERKLIFYAIAKNMMHKRGRKARTQIRAIPSKALIRHLSKRVPNVKLSGSDRSPP